jgi:YVTN family beta-propeller protein
MQASQLSAASKGIRKMKRPILTATIATLLSCAASSAFALTIFVSNEKDNTVTVIDGKTLEVIKTIPTARRPRGIIASPDPELMAVDPKGGILYIANEDDSMVTVMDTQERRGEGRDPGRRRARRHGGEPGFEIHGGDLREHEHGARHRQRDREARRQRVGRYAAARGEVHPGRQGGLGLLGGGRHRLGDRREHLEGHQEDPLRGAWVRPELLQPVGMEFSKDGKYLFAALGPGNRVAVIDPKTYEVKQYILVGQRPWHLELSPDQSKLYVANGLTNDMTIVDIASLKAEKSVPVGRLPWGVAVIP